MKEFISIRPGPIDNITSDEDFRDAEALTMTVREFIEALKAECRDDMSMPVFIVKDYTGRHANANSLCFFRGEYEDEEV